ncbi:hypothetical protein [Nevskia sp.]|uniref:hypothetical protein n=1 Tax=Nevskia sp. TaxID=1929292 RepID=UPI0025D8FF2A|nr:hypothetical protein [Nevskia sp.]
MSTFRVSRFSLATAFVASLLSLTTVKISAQDELPRATPEASIQPRNGSNACSWIEPDGNTAYPETHARYFRLTIPRARPDGVRLRISGDYLAVRYFSFQLYGPAFNAVDVLADHEIRPDPGSQSPFADITRIDPAVRPGGRYTVFVEFTDPPAQRAPNTLYAGRSLLPAVRNYLFLRAYLSVGSVPLPAIRYERHDGSPSADAPIDVVACGDGPDLPLLGSADVLLPESAVSSLLLPTVPIDAIRSGGGSRDVPFEVYRGLGGGLGTGVVYNQNAGFMSARIDNRDDLVLVRFRAPSYPAFGGAALPDVRYWSLCQNRQALQTVLACVADREATIDGDGFFHAVIGSIHGRPLGADARNGFAFLPNAGLIDNGFLIYRQILSRPDFAGAITRVPADRAPIDVLGDYTPQGTTCPPALFVARTLAGDSPAQVFAACRAAR